jgi:hypothetical protein
MGIPEYDLTIDPTPLNNNHFLEAGLAIVSPPLDDPQFKVKKTATGLTKMLMADEIISKDKALFNDYFKTIRVKDEYCGTVGSINSFQNSFRQITRDPKEESVRGPLPLLGVGAPFGFSRRLRSRFMAARRG